MIFGCMSERRNINMEKSNKKVEEKVLSASQTKDFGDLFVVLLVQLPPQASPKTERRSPCVERCVIWFLKCLSKKKA